MAIALRAPEPGDLDALIALQAREAGTAPPMAPAFLAASLFDEARGHGQHVRIAVDEAGAIAGAIGWVIGDGVRFASPFIAPAPAAAEALLDALFAALDGATTSIRSSTGAPASPRAQAMRARGFTPCFDFVDYGRPTAPLAPRPPPAGTRVVEHGALDRAALRAIYNATFDGVPNALPMSAAQIDEVLDGPLVFAAGTAALLDDHGAYAGFLHGDRLTDAAGEHVTVEAVGVAPAWRGRGVGAWLVERLLDRAHAAGIGEARALIASTNAPSIALHTRLGFGERFRRHVWEWRRP